MTILYENKRRAGRARLGVVTAGLWAVGWFVWASILNSGGTRSGIVILMLAVGLAPLVALYFYSSVYVVRIVREDDAVTITSLGLIRNSEVRIPLSAITEVTQPEARGMTIKVAGRQMPFIVDLLAERGDLNAIKALAHHKATRNS
ncbi:MAG: hypothetical protein ACO1NY_07545 [Pseudorhodoplanes sp.]